MLAHPIRLVGVQLLFFIAFSASAQFPGPGKYVEHIEHTDSTENFYVLKGREVREMDANELIHSVHAEGTLTEFEAGERFEHHIYFRSNGRLDSIQFFGPRYTFDSLYLGTDIFTYQGTELASHTRYLLPSAGAFPRMRYRVWRRLYTYDEQGQLKTFAPQNFSQDTLVPNDRLVAYEYDAEGRLLMEKYFDARGELWKEVEYIRGGDDLLDTMNTMSYDGAVLKRSEVEVFIYDAQRRHAQFQHFLFNGRSRLAIQSGDLTQSAVFEHFSDGTMKAVSTGHPVLEGEDLRQKTYWYDDRHRLVRSQVNGFRTINEYVYPEWVTAVDEPKEESSSITLFPNPARDILNIQSGTPIDQWRIIDLTGRDVSSSVKFDGQSGQMDVSQLPNGLYILFLPMEDGSQSLRFAKD